MPATLHEEKAALHLRYKMKRRAPSPHSGNAPKRQATITQFLRIRPDSPPTPLPSLRALRPPAPPRTPSPPPSPAAAIGDEIRRWIAALPATSPLVGPLGSGIRMPLRSHDGRSLTWEKLADEVCVPGPSSQAY